MTRAFFVALALLAAAPAQAADCSKVVQAAAFKRAVAHECGYGVNTGEVEAQAQACGRRMTAEQHRQAEVTGSSIFGAMRRDMGLQRACRRVLRDMRDGFVAD